MKKATEKTATLTRDGQWVMFVTSGRTVTTMSNSADEGTLQMSATQRRERMARLLLAGWKWKV